MYVLFVLRLSTSFAYYGLAMDLQKFGVDIYLIQVIFGAVDIPAKVVVTVCMSFIGRRFSQCGALIIAGVTILINVLVPYGMLEHMHRLQYIYRLFVLTTLCCGFPPHASPLCR